MLTTALLLAALSATPSPLKVAATRFNVIDLTADRADFYTEHFADQLAAQGVTVITPREVATLIGLERQKQLLGCEETGSCVAEIANALGVEAVTMGDIAKLGDQFQVNIKVIGAARGERLATFSTSAKSEGAVLEQLGYGANQLAIQLAKSFGRTPPATMAAPVDAKRSTATAVEQPTPGGSKRFWWAPAVVGVAGLGLGTYGLIGASTAKTRLDTETFNGEQGAELLSFGQTHRTLGYVGLGVGAAGLAAAAALALFGSDGATTPMLSAGVGAGGGEVLIRGEFP